MVDSNEITNLIWELKGYLEYTFHESADSWVVRADWQYPLHQLQKCYLCEKRSSSVAQTHTLICNKEPFKLNSAHPTNYI